MNGHYAVLGATGAQGGAVVTALTERGASVRAITRHLQSPRAQQLARTGVEVIAADLFDGDAVAHAFTGVDGVFALTTPFEDGPSAELEQGATIIGAAERAQVPHLVFSSVSDADRHTGIPHFDSKAQVESALAKSAVPHTIVGPTYFYDNLLGDVDQLRAGRLVMPMPADVPLQQLSRRDLGRLVAAILADPSPLRGVRMDIASDNPTARQMASVVEDVLGRSIEVESVDAHQIASPDMRAMFVFLSDTGYSVDIPRLHSAYPDVGWQTFRDWAQSALAKYSGRQVR